MTLSSATRVARLRARVAHAVLADHGRRSTRPRDPAPAKSQRSTRPSGGSHWRCRPPSSIRKLTTGRRSGRAKAPADCPLQRSSTELWSEHLLKRYRRHAPNGSRWSMLGTSGRRDPEVSPRRRARTELGRHSGSPQACPRGSRRARRGADPVADHQSLKLAYVGEQGAVTATIDPRVAAAAARMRFPATSTTSTPLSCPSSRAILGVRPRPAADPMYARPEAAVFSSTNAMIARVVSGPARRDPAPTPATASIDPDHAPPSHLAKRASGAAD